MGSTTNRGYPTILASETTKSFLEFRTSVLDDVATSFVYKVDEDMQNTIDSVDDLAGSGRTTETVKDNADAITVIQSNEIYKFSVTGTNAYTVTGVTGITSYYNGLNIRFTASNDNTGNSTININSLGVKSLTKINSAGNAVDIEIGDIRQNAYVDFQYNGTSFVMIQVSDADRINVLDTDGNFTATKVEGVLDEIDKKIRNAQSITPNDVVGNTTPGDIFNDGIANYSVINATGTDDATNVKIGDKAIRATFGASATSPLIRREGVNLDFTKLKNGENSPDSDFVEMALYVSNVSALNGDVALALSQGATYDDTNVIFLVRSASSLVNGWNYIDFKKSINTTVGAGSFSGIQSWQIQLSNNAGFAGEYITAQLFYNVKADPDDPNKPNVFQENGVRIGELNSGEYYAGLEFGVNKIKELSTSTTDVDSVLLIPEYENFEIFTQRIQDATTSNLYGAVWYQDANNNITVSIQAEKLLIEKTEAGSTTSIFTDEFPINPGDKVEYEFKKDGANLIATGRIGTKVLTISTTTTITGTGRVGWGSTSLANNDVLINFGVSKISYCSKSGQASLSEELINKHISFEPTLTFTGTPPASITTVARYTEIGSRVFFDISLSSADGNGATDLQISLPKTPKDNNGVISVSAQEKVDTTWSNPIAYIDDDSGNGIEFRNFSTATDTVAWEMIVSGNYEV